MKILKAILPLLLMPLATMTVSSAQPAQNTNQPIYQVPINLVGRTTKAINYQHRNGSTPIDFRGTPLLPAAHGYADVESKQGYVKIEARFRDLEAATRFGPEFLTYVMWTVTPEGRASNVGEVILNGKKSKLDVTTQLQTFGLIVTAEPYFGVTQPSELVVMENHVTAETVGSVERIAAKYQLLQRDHYTFNVLPADLKPISLDKNTPLDLYEARNAVRIARWAGAERWASEIFLKANDLLAQAEMAQVNKSGDKTVSTSARAAVQTAEDARLIGYKNQTESRLAQERSAAASREVAANAAAAGAQAQANAAEQAHAASEKREAAAYTAVNVAAAGARAQANAAEQAHAASEKREAAAYAAVNAAAAGARADASAAERAWAASAGREASANAAAADARADANTAERARNASEGREAVANKAAADAVAQTNAAEKARATAQIQTERTALNAQAEAQRSADQASLVAERTRMETAFAAREKAGAATASQHALKLTAEKSELEKEDIRKKLVTQLNRALDTRDSTRGLIVNMSDVLFDTGEYSLNAGAREKLARVSGILQGYPSLKLEVEGHTDSVGADDLNMKLSENRARSVRDFMVQQGITVASIGSNGWGASQPVATNDTAAGRQQNRRVELVVSGEAINTSAR